MHPSCRSRARSGGGGYDLARRAAAPDRSVASGPSRPSPDGPSDPPARGAREPLPDRRPMTAIGLRRPSLRAAVVVVLVLIVLGGALGAGMVSANAFGLGDKFDRLVAKVERLIVGPPPPDRATVPTVTVTEPPATPPPTPAPTLPPGASPTPVADAPGPRRGRRQRRAGPGRRLRPRDPEGLVRPGRRPDDARRARPGRHVRGVPEGPRRPDPRVGDLRRQPQLRVGPLGDGVRARGVRRAGLPDPGLRLARPARCATPRSRSRRRTRRRSCWPGAAPTRG